MQFATRVAWSLGRGARRPAIRPIRSGEEALDHLNGDVSVAKAAAVVGVHQPLVIDAEIEEGSGNDHEYSEEMTSPRFNWVGRPCWSRISEAGSTPNAV